PDQATPVFLLSYTGVVLAGIGFSGVAAAIMSTVNSFLNLAAAAITRDLRGGDVTSEAGLRAGHIAMVGTALPGVLPALGSGTLVALLGVFGFGLFASTLVPALALGMAWPGATRAGAVASIITGLVLTLGLESMAWTGALALPGVNVSAMALLASLLVFI